MYLRSPAGWVYPPITTEPEGARKYFGALLVGFYEGRRLKFAGGAGTGFSDKLLRSLILSLPIYAESALKSVLFTMCRLPVTAIVIKD
jgi:hypothetical protein